MSKSYPEETVIKIISVTVETAEQFPDLIPEDIVCRLSLPGYYALGSA